MKKQLFYLFSFLVVIATVSSCAKDDWDDDDNKVTYSVPAVDVSGVWYQSGATLGGYSAYMGLHLNKAGKGHVLFYAKSASKYAYYEINSSVDGEILTINGCSVYEGNYLVESVGSSNLKLRQGNYTQSYSKAKELTPANLASRGYWGINTSSTNYIRYYFNSNNTGKVVSKSGSSSPKTSNFTYTCSEETGTLDITYSSGSKEIFEYACILNNTLILIERNSSGVSCYTLD
jgi:hypothetical protein